jgi:short-subunit dehydrogenase
MQNKVVVITGGSSGIGKALAFELGKAGAKIAITGRNATLLREVSAQLSEQHIQHLALVADVSIEQDNQRMAQQVVEHFGGIDMLINNAGITMRAMFEETDSSVFHKVMNINFFGTLYATKYCLPYIKLRKGSIVGVSSVAGYRGLPVRSGYSASKFAMNGFLEALRAELLNTGVHVLTVCPGFTTSNIRVAALGKTGEVTGETVRDENNMMPAEEVAKRIRKAIEKRKKEVIFTNMGFWTVWLNKLFPRLVDKLVVMTLAKEKDSPLVKVLHTDATE